MPRILAIDYGKKRVGVSETDDLQIIASPLSTISTAEIFPFLKDYLSRYQVSDIVVGQPFRMSGEISVIEEDILKFIERFKKQFPEVAVHRVNEAFTSKLAVDAMLKSGMRKKKRKEKGSVDKIAATLILQDFLEHKRNSKI